MSLARELDSSLPERQVTCPSALQLESWVAGDPTSAAMEEHCRECSHCHTYVTHLRAEQDAFFKQNTPELFARKMALRAAAPKRVFWRGLGFALPLLAGLALIFLFRPPQTDDVRLKGAEAFRVFYKREGMVNAGTVSHDMHLRAGDVLRFAYTAPSEGYVMVLDVDGTGKATTFYPFEGTHAQPISAGTQTLTGSVVLDAAPGPEWIVAVFQTTPFDANELLAHLQRVSTSTDRLTLPCGKCVVSAVRLQKAP